MSSVHPVSRVRELLDQRLSQRGLAGAAFFDAESERIAALCHRMAERFARGGRLIATGVSPAARSDVHHVTVEFVHPVIVGKRALPALGLAGESAGVAHELGLTAEPDDIVIVFGEVSDGAELAAALATARERGCETVAFSQLDAEWVLEPPDPDPFVRQEVVETTYHVLWELVHVFFEHRGLLEGRTERRAHDVGASSFLYPFLAEREHDLDSVLADVRASVLMKAEEVQGLRVATLEGAATVLAEAATAMRRGLDGGGRVLALGNGGSATDAADLVADFVGPPAVFGWPSRPAIDLVADTAIVTAIANDIGSEAIFARQIIAHGRPGDALLALSTSGSSLSVLDALARGAPARAA